VNFTGLKCDAVAAGRSSDALGVGGFALLKYAHGAVAIESPAAANTKTPGAFAISGSSLLQRSVYVCVYVSMCVDSTFECSNPSLIPF
jgi:hypothetical protein